MLDFSSSDLCYTRAWTLQGSPTLFLEYESAYPGRLHHQSPPSISSNVSYRRHLLYYDRFQLRLRNILRGRTKSDHPSGRRVSISTQSSAQPSSKHPRVAYLAPRQKSLLCSKHAATQFSPTALLSLPTYVLMEEGLTRSPLRRPPMVLAWQS